MIMDLDGKSTTTAAERNATEQAKLINSTVAVKTTPQGIRTSEESSSTAIFSMSDKAESVAAKSNNSLSPAGSGLHLAGASQSTFSDPTVGMVQAPSVQVDTVNSAPPAEKKPISFEASTTARTPRSTPARLPLVFKAVDPMVVGLSDLDMKNIEVLRESFQAEIGKQDGNDPNYRRRWLRAQSKVDEQLRADLGWSLFSRYQIEASKDQ
jgi:hypothetical protein